MRHPLAGPGAPWSAEWAAGRVDGSPRSPWWRLDGITRTAFAAVLYPRHDPDADLRRVLAEMRTEGPNHE